MNLKTNGMNTPPGNQYHAIERLIFQTGVRITELRFEMEQDSMIVMLTSGKGLRFRLSAFKCFQGKLADALLRYELTAGGLGIHWPDLDDDLSLKGFLEEELKLTIGEYSYAMAA